MKFFSIVAVILICNIAELCAAPTLKVNRTTSNTKVARPLANSNVQTPKEPCSGGEPGPGRTCHCYVSKKTGYQRCLPKPGDVDCDYDTDCGVPPPGVFVGGGAATYVPPIGAPVPNWYGFTF